MTITHRNLATILLVIFITPQIIEGDVGDNCTDTLNCVAEEEVCNNLVCACNVGFEAINTTCVKGCPEPPPIEYGSVEVVSNTTSLNIEAVYSCPEGYDLNGSPRLVCDELGNWTVNPPTCSDPCAINPCPAINEQQVPCTANVSGDGHVCICPNGTKGHNCSIEDNHIECRRKNKQIRFERNPDEDNRTVCVVKADTNETFACYPGDEGETIKYTFDPSGYDISVEDKFNRFCLTYLSPPDVPSLCVNVIAYEYHDFLYRPWLNDTLEICFIFNKIPKILNIPSEDLRFNVVDMETEATVPLLSGDRDDDQTITWSVTVYPEDRSSFFNIDGENLKILNPKSTHNEPNDTIYNSPTIIELTSTDNGIPVLEDMRNFTVVFKYLEFVCVPSKELYLLHLNQIPESYITLGNIECSVTTNQASDHVYDITSEPGPVVIISDGEIQYNPVAIDNRGTYSITVKISATVAGFNVTSNVAFVVLADNLQPTCTQSENTAIFSEKADVETCSDVLYTCYGPANLTKSCSDVSDKFNVTCDVDETNNAVAVHVCVGKSIDFDGNTTETVTITVSNDYGEDVVTSDVTIENVNDPPVLMPQVSPLSLTIEENRQVNDVLVTIPVADPDVDSDSIAETLEAKLTDLSNSGQALPFDVNVSAFGNAVNLILTNTLNGAERSSYSLEITVEDLALASDSVVVDIAVQDINEVPVCDPEFITAQATVRDEVGEVVTQLTCSDEDFNITFNTLTYTIRDDSNAAGYFQIDSTGTITLATSLADVTDSLLSITVDVVDGGGLSTSVDVEVNVTSNYPPRCDSNTLSETVLETSTGCFDVSIPCVDDVDNSGQIQFIVNSGNGSQLFDLPETSVNNQILSFCPKIELQGLVGKYVFVGVARSQYGDTDLQVVITVEDVNQPPECTVVEVIAFVEVTQLEGHVITSLSCGDVDVTLDFKTLTYSITDDTDGYFAVSTNGEVSLARRLTDITESGTVLSFNIKVSDDGGLEVIIPAQVTVDANFPPECENYELAESKSEMIEADVCFNVGNLCEDIVTNETLSYAILNGNGTSLFTLNAQSSTNSLLSICTLMSLQGHVGNWELNISVSSSFGQNFVTVVIIIIDVNEAPIFVGAPFTNDVPEDANVGSVILIVSASDTDIGIFGSLTFHSQDIDDSNLFSLDMNSGEIKLISALDAETSTLHEFEIEVKDGGSPQLSNTTTVTINVQDINDNPPQCTKQTVDVDLHLLDPVNTTVYNLECTDLDLTAEFRQIVYSVSSDLFHVNAIGRVVINSPLPHNQTSHVITVQVQDADNSNFRIEVVINVNVDTNVPPECDSTSITLTIDETETVGKCVDKEVICEDPAGREVALLSENGTAVDLFHIRYHSKQSRQLGLNACILDIKDHFGTFELIGVVTNGLGTTTVTWTLTVINVNEAPVFFNSPYNIDLLETVSYPDEPVLVINVTDPDNGKGNPNFVLPVNSVNSLVTNDEDYDSQTHNAFLFVKAILPEFYAIKEFNATVRNLYTFTVTATDAGGLSNSTDVTINIIDVNSAPICEPATVTAKTNILATIGTEVVTLFCYDTDISPQYTSLNYEIVNTGSDQYFNITSEGVIIVAEVLPREKLYGTGEASLNVLVSDGGNPPLSYTSNVIITVDNSIPVDCTPVITYPPIWVVESCVNITMDCTDPTKGGTDHLAFQPSGNYTTGFRLASDEMGVIDLCYTRQTSGIYKITITVSNGLENATFEEIIVVSYLKAIPMFTSIKYTETVDENTAAGESVLTVSASSSQPVGQIIYTVIDSASSANWSAYLMLDSTSGVISTIAPLRSKANTEIILKVEAEDTGSKLKSSAQVEITVEDMNESPSCGVISTKLNNVDVDVDVGTKLITFECSDPDVKPEYKTLSYQISGDLVNTYFKLDGEPINAVVVKSPLHVSTSQYVVTLTVEDGGTPPKLYTKDFTITVSNLPPPVEVEVADKADTWLQIHFKYAREDFYQVTRYFVVKALTTDNELVHSSGQLTNVEQTYNITGLEAQTPYSLVVEANTDFGTKKSNILIIVTKVTPVFRYLTISFVIPDVEYNERLRDNGSQLYYENRAVVDTDLNFVLKNDKGFAGVSRITFRKWNSVMVDAVIAMNQTAEPENTMSTLKQAVESGWLKDLSVDSTYFVGSYGAGYISLSNITQTPSEIYNGTSATLECRILTVGYKESDTFTYRWTFRGTEIQPTEQSRYRITTTTDPLEYESKISVLRIDPMLTYYEGRYGCRVNDSSQQEEQVKYIDVKVIGQPIVVVDPKYQIVEYMDTVTVMCLLVFTPGTFQGFEWYRDGAPYVQASNEELKDGAINSTITINGITETTTFTCKGVNQAGPSAPVMTTVSVIPPDITEAEKCPEDKDDRDTVWPSSVPDSVVRLDCASNYIGEVYRFCDAAGHWDSPFYDCVSNDLIQIEQQANQVKDGSSFTDLNTVLSDIQTFTDDNDIFEGDLQTILNTLDTVVEVASTDEEDRIVEETESILQIASNLIDDHRPWISVIEKRKEGAIDVPGIVEDYLDKTLDSLAENTEYNYNVTNIYVQIRSGKQSTYVFPDKSTELPSWVASSGTEIKIQGNALKDLSTVHYASSFYRDISSILVKKLKNDNGEIVDITDTKDINSDIVSFQLKERISVIDPPAEIIFKHFDSNYSQPVCCYWDFTEGTFLTDGCELVSTNDEYTVCSCNHFTNFAVLMSPGKTPEADVMALSIISAVGCGISIFCLLLTIILYILVWRYVKSDRAILLLHLCVALIISYAIFLGGVNQAQNETLCTVISALLHYFYLVVFFLMLAYGIEIAVCVVYVFVTRSRIRWLLPLAWGIPLLIVGASLGATQLEGYGNDRFCWLSTEDGVLWAFVGPALLIILINFVIVVIVLRQMFKSSVMMTKSDKEKAVTGVRSICVLLPILGLTWVFGVFSVNEDMIVFQYIFAICNTLQGFLIFLFHCILNKPLLQALKQRNEKKKSLASIESTFKNQQSTANSTGFYSSDTKSSQPKNNVDAETTETSNPFLQADRQMKELVAKNKTGTNVNDVNNKLDKDFNKAVDLEDVKISNILRESEVMGGAAGVSSILHDQPKDGYLSRGSNRSVRFMELPVTRDSKISSHRYDYIDPYRQKSTGYDSLVPGNSSSKSSAHSDRSRERRQRELEREREEERMKQLEYERRDKQERERKEREKREREKIERDRERQERERKEREKKERQKNKNVIKIGYGSDTYLGGDSRSRDHSRERRGPQRPRGPSRSDDDYEGNISSISTALPEKFDFYQGNKRQKEAKKQAENLQKKKEKKKSSLKDRSAPYEYSYDSTYLGGSSRHASLENMNMQQYGYSPYSQMPGMGGYQTGRPTHQQQHWDQYRYPRDPRDPYGRDYW